MTFLKAYLIPLKIFVLTFLIFQIIFIFLAPSFTATRYEARLYATLGIVFQGNDLEKLNEAAHYFGQTLIGWTQFPQFRSKLIETAHLPADVSFSMHAQERQNFIFNLQSSQPLTPEQVKGAFQVLQDELKIYNEKTKTEFVVAHQDQEFLVHQRTYAQGALLMTLAALIATLALLFIRRELRLPSAPR